jgi:hypothetical protein
MTRRKLLSWCVYFFYVVGIIAGVDYVFYRFYVSRIMPVRGQEVYNTITGNVPVSTQNGLSRFGKGERNNVIRVGCFGDSFTRGAEVSDKYDYPTLLQDIFRRNGYDNVEVINFGLSGAGFHQVFNIWKFLAQDYHLDYVIILDGECFTYDRDATFAAVPRVRQFSPRLHARYIVKNKRVELVEVFGHTVGENMKEYFSFIPHLRYLLYDRRPPAFLAAPVYFLLPGKEFKWNPFYYRRDLTKEMQDIYTLLLEEMTAKAPQVILCHFRDEFPAVGPVLDKSNLSWFRMALPIGFPYKAALEHNSPNGNQLVAQQLFDCLTGRAESAPMVMRTVAISEQAAGGPRIKTQKLSEYARIGIELDGVTVGHFYDPRSGDWPRYCQGPGCELTVNALAHTASLVAFQDSNYSLLDWPFLSLDSVIGEETPVTVRFTQNGTTQDIAWGKITLLRPGLPIGAIDTGLLHYHRTKDRFSFDAGARVQRHGPLGPGKVTVLFNNISVLSGEIKANNQEFKLSPVRGSIFVIKPDGNKIVDLTTIGPASVFYLSLESEQPGSSIKIPVARWVKAEEKVIFEKPVARPISRIHNPN